MKNPTFTFLLFLILIFANSSNAHIPFDASSNFGETIMSMPDLTAGDVKGTLKGKAGAVVEFTFDLINSGDTLAAGDYFINIYLSEDSALSADDPKVGDILTGNTGVGTIDDVLAAISIPGNAETGFYSLIISVDDGAVIDEFDENNNLLVADFEVVDMVGPSDESCGFLKDYGMYATIATFPRPAPILRETEDGYVLNQRISDPSLSADFVEVNVDLAGELISINEYTGSGLKKEVTTDVEDTIVTVSYYDENGAVVWSQDLAVTSNYTLEAIVKVTGEVTKDGIAVVGSYANQGGPALFLFFSFILDFEGNILHENYDMESEVYIDFPGINEMYETNAGYVYNIFPGDGSLKFISFSKTGELIWTVTHANDTPSNNPAGYQVSIDGDFIYAAHRNNEKALLNKYNSWTGVAEYNVDLSLLFAQGGYFRTVTSFNDFAQLADGGIVAGYRHKDFYNGGIDFYEYGKINQSGTLVWTHQFSADMGVFRANLETTDGGILFYSEPDIVNGSDLELSYLKVTSTGELTPECEDDPTVGISNNKFENDINIYPNPATDILNIEFENEEWSKESLTLFNALGQRESQVNLSTNGNLAQFNVNYLTSGVYYLVLENNNGEQRVEKILVVE